MSLRKIVFILFGIIVFQFVVLAIMPWPDHADYQENDRYSYYFYTDIDIKNAPRVSGGYFFSFDTPRDEQKGMSSIQYTDGNVMIIKDYLMKLGYHLFQAVPVENGGTEESWLSASGGNGMFYVFYSSNSTKIILTKVSF